MEKTVWRVVNAKDDGIVWECEKCGQVMQSRRRYPTITCPNCERRKHDLRKL